MVRYRKNCRWGALSPSGWMARGRALLVNRAIRILITYSVPVHNTADSVPVTVLCISVKDAYVPTDTRVVRSLLESSTLYFSPKSSKAA